VSLLQCINLPSGEFSNGGSGQLVSIRSISCFYTVRIHINVPPNHAFNADPSPAGSSFLVGAGGGAGPVN